MRVAILFTPAPPDAPPQDLDGLVQLDSVKKALESLGHEAISIGFELNLESVRAQLLAASCDCVFNLVESVAGQDRLLALAPALLEAMGLPFTGAGLTGTLLTTQKILAKRMLRQAGLPTAEWLEPFGQSPTLPAKGQKVILKSAWDHGSAGLSDETISSYEDPDQLLQKLRMRSNQPGQEWFAERFIDGREFNLSVLANKSGPEVLPPAEIRFEDYAPGKPRMVGYKAKWDDKSFEYSHTPRSFDFKESDNGLLEKLKELSLRCWQLFGLRGFVRVDFRVDSGGQPWILEINVNPCLSPDAGFAAAVQRAGLSYPGAIERILNDGR